MLVYIYGVIKELEMALTENQVKDVIARALIKAWEEDIFKHELLANPIDSIEKLTGERIIFNNSKQLSIGNQLKLKSFELNVSSDDGFEGIELNEQELDLAAGGTMPNFSSEKDFITFLKSYI